MINIRIDGKVKTVKGVYYKVGNELKRLLVQMKDGNQVRDFIKYTIQKNLVYDFSESTSSSRSNTFTIDDLISVDEITVDNGSVSYTINNNKVTVSVSGGSPRRVWSDTRYSKAVTDYTTSSIDSFSSTKSYSSSGYSGNLRMNGSSYVSSGSYAPADSKVVKVIKTVSGGLKYTWNGSEWTSQRVDINGSNTISYNEDGYSGILKANGLNVISATGIFAGSAQSEWKAAHPTGSAGESHTLYGSETFEYSGTVTRPESDTRIYMQDYSGTVYMGGYYDYYKYKINMKYTIKN